VASSVAILGAGANAVVAFPMDRTTDVLALFGVQGEGYVFQPRHHSLTMLGRARH